jgi:hypothetical protein
MFDISKLGNDYKVETIAKDYLEKYPLSRSVTDINATHPILNTTNGHTPQTENINETREEIKVRDDRDKLLRKKRSTDELNMENNKKSK